MFVVSRCDICWQALSREHACIEVRSGQHFVVDNASRNKTRRGKVSV